MSMEVATNDRKTPTRQRLSAKLTAALDDIVWLGMPFDDAARKQGITVRAMRYALERSHVIAYLRKQREVFRESISAGNIHTYRDVRDNSVNSIARIQAANALERLEDQGHSAGAQRHAPGLVVQIINTPSASHVLPQHDVKVIDANDIKGLTDETS